MPIYLRRRFIDFYNEDMAKQEEQIKKQSKSKRKK